MAMTNEQAMQDLQTAKAGASDSDYRNGVFIGMCNAFWLAEIITFDQYKRLTGMECEAA